MAIDSELPTNGVNSSTRYLGELKTGNPIAMTGIVAALHISGCVGPRYLMQRLREHRLLAWAASDLSRLDHVVHHLGLALGGHPAASFAQRPMLPVSSDSWCCWPPTRQSVFHPSKCGRDRRVGVAAKPTTRNDHLRS